MQRVTLAGHPLSVSGGSCGSDSIGGGMAARPCVLARHTRPHVARVPSRHATVTNLCRDLKKPHPSVCFFVPQAASAFRGPPVRIATSPHHEPRCGRRFRLPSDTAGAHGGRRYVTGAPGPCPDRSRPRPPDGSPGETDRPHPHPQRSRPHRRLPALAIRRTPAEVAPWRWRFDLRFLPDPRCDASTHKEGVAIPGAKAPTQVNLALGGLDQAEGGFVTDVLFVQ